MKGPETIETNRLMLLRLVLADAEAVFSRYASDPEVTRFLSWPRHRSIEDRDQRRLPGNTGLSFQTPIFAETGYVLARDAWGLGYATEALGAMVLAAPTLGAEQLVAFCHPANRSSARVLEKCGFLLDDSRPHVIAFPNSGENQPVECLCYSRRFGRTK